MNSNVSYKKVNQQAEQFKKLYKKVEEIHEFIFERSVRMIPKYGDEKRSNRWIQRKVKEYMKECLEKISFDQSKLYDDY